MDLESQERFRKMEEMMLKFAMNNLVIQQQIDNNNILLDQLIKSQLRLEESNEKLRVMTEELRASNEESRSREFRLEEITTSHQRVLRLHEGRISQIETAT